MAAGNKPSHRLVAVTRGDAPRKYDDLGAAWPSERVEGSYGVKLEDGARIKDGDGNVYSNETHFFNFEPVRPKKGAKTTKAADADSDDDEDGDVKF